jgi:hypothetical protein
MEYLDVISLPIMTQSCATARLSSAKEKPACGE